MSRLLENELLILTEPFNQPFGQKGTSQMPNCGPGYSIRACIGIPKTSPRFSESPGGFTQPARSLIHHRERMQSKISKKMNK